MDRRRSTSAGRRRGMILPVMLLILILLGLLTAGFAFRVHADHSAMNAVAFRLHTRLAAEAGVEKVLLGLRTMQNNVQAWYDNPDELNRIIVWTPNDETVWGTNEELDEGTVAYRFSIVADHPADDEERSRFGITDESAKLNINVATREQLINLISRIATEDMVVPELADALLDWRDEDDDPRESGAEVEYYGTLDTPYRPKNGSFDTVEELLMVRGFDGRVLYGEDYDRNGLLGPNEDDGDESFPEDNGDGVLNRGLYPYITVISRDTNTDSENRPRILLTGGEQISESLSQYFDSAKVAFIVAAASGGGSEEGDEQGDEQASDEDQLETPEEEEPADAGEEESTKDEVRSQSLSTSGERRSGRRQIGGNSQSGTGSVTSQPTSQAADESASLKSPADLLTIETDQANPLTLEDLPILMDRTTMADPLVEQPGLINVLTAPPQVLSCVPGLTGDDVAAIVQIRADLSEEEQVSTAWLVTREAVSLETYQQAAPYITVRGRQFTIESLGYADHIGTIYRLQVMVEMRGPVPQVVYYRDLTPLGAVFPIREGEGEYGFGGTGS